VKKHGKGTCGVEFKGKKGIQPKRGACASVLTGDEGGKRDITGEYGHGNPAEKKLPTEKEERRGSILPYVLDGKDV